MFFQFADVHVFKLQNSKKKKCILTYIECDNKWIHNPKLINTLLQIVKLHTASYYNENDGLVYKIRNTTVSALNILLILVSHHFASYEIPSCSWTVEKAVKFNIGVIYLLGEKNAKIIQPYAE